MGCHVNSDEARLQYAIATAKVALSAGEDIDVALGKGIQAGLSDEHEREMELVRDRCQGAFLDYVNTIARYWLGEGGSNVPDTYSLAERLDGFTHSLLAEIDGCGSYEMELIFKDEVTGMRLDIGGGLHELMRRVDK